MRYLITILFFLLLVPSVLAQSYKFKIYNTSSGLPNNAVYYILQDSKGYVWFATNDGVCRYDGVKYQSFTMEQGLADNSVRAIVEDKKGDLWFLTRSGITRYNGSKFTSYTINEGLPENEIRSGLCAENGSLWFGTSKGLSHFDGEKFINYGLEVGLPNSPIWKILEAKSGELWLGLRGAGLAKFDGKKFTVYGKAQGLLDENVFDLALDSDNGVWIATGGGVYYFSQENFRPYTSLDGLGSERVSSIRLDRFGRVWCGTYGGGISRLEKDGHFTVFNRKNGLPDDYIISHMQDYEGNIWWGTQRSGVFYFLNEKFSNYTEKNGIGEGTISALSQASDGTMWFSSFSNGLISLSPDGKTQSYGIKDGLMEEELWAVLVDSRGRVWTGGHKGISCYEKGRFTNFLPSQIGIKTRITAFIEDKQGRIWIGSDSSTSDGIVVYDNNEFTFYSTKEGLIKNQVNSFALDNKGNLWVCTEGGLSCFNGKDFINYTEKEGLPNKYVHRFYQDEQGYFWVGMGVGIARFDGKTFQYYTKKDGLSDNAIRSITSYDGALWIGTLRGISVFDGKKFTNYTIKNGLVNDGITNGIKSTIDNSLWFSTIEGVVRYQPKEQLLVTKAPILHITSILAGEEQISLTDYLSVDYKQNTVKFDFVALSFTDETAIRYSYLLENFDNKWSEPSEQRLARFTNLPAREYTFLVKAVSAAGIWSQPIAIKFEVLPPYWQTWWFRFLVIVVMALLAYGVYAWRIEAFRRRHESRIASLRQLLESIQVINSQLELETVLQDIVSQSAKLIGAEPGGIGLVEDNNIVFHRLWLKDHWQNDLLQFPIEDSIVGQAVTKAETIVINEPTEEELNFPNNLKPYYKNGFMDVPIITRTGKVVGVLDIRRRMGKPLFTKLDRQLIESLANQAAVAIENAALYGELAKLYHNEQQITRSLQDLDKMKTNFVILASHEMRTPLTILKGYHDVLLNASNDSLTKSQQRALAICQRTIDRLVVIANDILEMLKITEGKAMLKPTRFNLKDLVDEVISDLSGFIEKRNQKLYLSISNDISEVCLDKEKIRLILLNLLQNAIKFTLDKGEISLELIREKEFIHITVKDNGIGIVEKELERIFDKFYTGGDPMQHSSGKYEFGARGTGLGLAIAKNYAEIHGGRLWAESDGLGKGSSFHLLVPEKLS